MESYRIDEHDDTSKIVYPHAKGAKLHGLVDVSRLEAGVSKTRGAQPVNRSTRQIKARKRAAFEAIVSEYEGPLLRYAGRILFDRVAAQDVVQNTLLRLFRHWPGDLIPSPQLSSWLYRVAHNCAVDYLRRESRRHHVHKKHAEERSDFVAPNRGEGFRISEQAAKAAQALQQLSLREQQLVILKVYEEKTYKEISEITELSVSNVGYILHYAMKKLAGLMREPIEDAGKGSHEQPRP